MYKVVVLKSFREKSKKLFSKAELLEVEKFIKKLTVNPNIGKPLSYSYFREKKINGKRVYFLIYENVCIVLLVSASDKKLQQETINNIKLNFYEYKTFAENINKI